VIRTVLLSGFLSVLAVQSAGPGAAPQAYGSACPSAATSTVDLLAAARDLRVKGDVDGAFHCFAHAAEDAAMRGDAALEADARAAFAQAAYGQSRMDLAVAQANAARALFGKVDDRLRAAQMTRLLASVAYMRGDRPEAVRLYSAALEDFVALEAQRDRIGALNDLSRLLPAEPRRQRLEEALTLAREIGARDLEGLALHSRSDQHFVAGRFDEAVADLLQAIERLEGTDKVLQLADANVSLGRIMRAHGRQAEAVRYYDRAIAIQEKARHITGLAQSLNAKAIALSQLQRTTEARAAYERALELLKETGVARLINFAQGNLATFYGDEGDYPRAIRLLEEVVQRETEPYVLAYRHGSLALLFRKSNDAARALPHAERAIALARTTGNNDYLPTVLFWAALIYGDMGRTDEALAAVSEGIETLERIRARLVPLDFMKRGFGERWQELYGATIAILQRRGDHDQALTTSEQARARAFLDLLASRQLADRDTAPAPASVDLRQGGVASKAAARTVSAAEIAATATRLSSAILSYWVSADDVFIWVTPPGGPTRSARVPIARKELEKLVAASVPRPGQRTTLALGKLHALLIAPVRAWLPRATPLTIVPHGPLFRVSFAALPDAAGVYLIEQHAITYAPSISTLEFTARRLETTKIVNGTTYLLIADPSPLPAATPRLAALPAARRETSAIAGLVGRRRSVVLSGARAGEAGVRDSMRGARVLHFATHGVIRDDEPFESFLALGTGKPGPGSDGRLTVAELYAMDLKAELVVLSACSTATGPPSGDGISGLSRALFYAGASSVLATLWDVADEPSAMLMSRFYRHWQGGMSKRAALRQAQIDLLRALRAGTIAVKAGPGMVPLDEQPHYWAGYILVGEP
jgi:CHAT domain-containing protein